MAMIPAQPQRQLVVIDDSMLYAMASDARFVQAFPFLKGIASVRSRTQNNSGGCAKCRQTNRQVASGVNAIKQAIAHLGQPQKLRLKQLLNAVSVRVVYMDTGGRSISHTFK